MGKGLREKMKPMNDRERDDKGRFTDSRSRDDVFEAMDIGEPYTTSELADTLGVPRRTMYNILSDLHEIGRIRKKKPEERRAIWIREANEIDVG